MKFDIVHTFRNITLAQYEALFFNEAFNDALMPVAELKERKTLESREEGGKLYKKTLIKPDRELPGPVKKLTTGELSYVEDTVFDRAAHSQTWTSKISILTDKVKMGGKITFEAVPDGVRRRIAGEVEVSVFGLGGMIEKTVVQNLNETYDKIAAFTQRYIDEGKAPA